MWRLYISRSYFFGRSFINKPSTILALNKLLTDQSYKSKNKKKRWRFPQNYFPKFTLILYPSDKTEKFTKIVVDQFNFWNVEISGFPRTRKFDGKQGDLGVLSRQVSANSILEISWPFR